MKIYIAGRLFTEEERVLLEKIDKICKELGFDTFLPHKDAGILAKDRSNSKELFTEDATQIDKCSVIIAVLNGLVVDPGTSWEIGYAYSRKIPIIGYLSHITFFDPAKQLNPMIINSLKHLTGSLDELKQVLSTFNGLSQTPETQ